jgi:hypothetical protein
LFRIRLSYERQTSSLLPQARLKTVADLLATDPGQDKDLRKFGKKLRADFKLSSGAGSGVGQGHGEGQGPEEQGGARARGGTRKT